MLVTSSLTFAVRDGAASTAAGEAVSAEIEADAESWTPFTHREVLADGSERMEVFNAPVFRRDEEGSWDWADPAVVATGDASWPLAAPGLAVPVRFGASSDGLLELTSESATVRLTAPSLTIGTPTVDADGWVVYKDVAPDTDLRYRVSVAGVKEEIVLRSEAAPTSFSFALEDAEGALGRAFQLPGGGVRFEGSVDEAVGLALGAPVAYELGREPDEPAVEATGGSLSLSANSHGFDLSVGLDPQWLHGRQFPVALDPTVVFTKGTGLDLDAYTLYFGNGCGGCAPLSWYQHRFDLRAGSYVDATASNQRVRSFFDFDVSEVPAASQIHSASLSLYAYDCVAADENIHWYCDDGEHPLSVYALNEDWSSSSTWTELDGRFPATPLDTAILPPFDPGDPGRWVDLDVTAALPGWADRTTPNFGLGLRHGREHIDTAGVVVFHSSEATAAYAPRVVVTYTPQPPYVTALTHPQTEAWYNTRFNHGQVDFDFDDRDFDGGALQIVESCWLFSADPTVTFDQSNARCAAGSSYTVSSPDWGGGEWWFNVRYVFDTGALGAIGRFPVHLDETAPSTPAASSSTHSATDWSSSNDPRFEWTMELTDTPVGYSFVFDHETETLPDEWPEETVKTGLDRFAQYTDVADGEWWFHVRAQSAPKGLWGPSSGYWWVYDEEVGHRRVLIDATAPPAPEVGSPTHPDPDTWSVDDDATFTWTATDATSGLDALSWSLDQSSWTWPDKIPEDESGTATTQAYSDLAPGQWYFHIRARDKAGNWGAPAHRRIRIDDTAPLPPTISSTTHPDESRWYTVRDAAMAWSATDTAPIVAYSWVFSSTNSPNVDTVPEGSETSRIEAGLADGDWYFFVRAQNAAGLWSDVAGFRFQVDATGPATPTVTSATHPDPDAWYANDTPQFDVHADDVSGIDAYRYLLEAYPDGSVSASECGVDDTVDATGSQITIPGVPDGRWRFVVAVRNGAGLWNDPASCGEHLVRIDTTTPQMPGPLVSTTHPDPAIWYPSNDPTFTWPVASDPTSTIAGYSIALDKNATTIPDTTIEPTTTDANGDVSKSYTNHADGIWWFHVRAVDAAGNGSTTLHRQVRFDGTAPTAPSISSTTGHGQTTWSSNDDPGFAWSASDTAPITDYDWTIELNNPTASPGFTQRGLVTSTSYSNRANGSWTFAVRTRNAAGHWSAPARYTVNIDDTPPAPPAVSSTTHPNQNSWYTNDDPRFAWSASDTAPINGYDYTLTRDVDANPGTSSRGTGTTASWSNMDDGIWWFHVRARNASGLWSGIASYRANIRPVCSETAGDIVVTRPDGLTFDASPTSVAGSVPPGSTAVHLYRDANGDGNLDVGTDPQVAVTGVDQQASTFDVLVPLVDGANCFFLRRRVPDGTFGTEVNAPVIFRAGTGASGSDDTPAPGFVLVKMAPEFLGIDPSLLLPLATDATPVFPSAEDRLLRLWWFVEVPEGTENEAVELYSADPRVLHSSRGGEVTEDTVAPPDWRYSNSVDGAPAQRDYLRDWYNLEVAWDVMNKGQGAKRVGVIDTGVSLGRKADGTDLVHFDLDANLAMPQRDCVTNTKNNCPYASDPYGFIDMHGTQMASILAAETGTTQGMAAVGWGLKFISFRTSQGRDHGGCKSRDLLCYRDEAIRIIADEAASNDVGVINISSGSTYFKHVLQDAINYAGRRGIVVVGSAGNETDSSRRYPAATHGAIAVGNATLSDPLRRRSRNSQFGSWLDLGAIGENVTTATFEEGWGGDPDSDSPGFAFAPKDGADWNTGTSGAAATVSGAIALMTADGQKPLRAAHRVLSAVTPYSDPNIALGWGLLDAGAAATADTVRLFGRDRLETAVEVSRETFPGAPGASPASIWVPSALILARATDPPGGQGFADSLVAASMAGVVDAPVLLIDDGDEEYHRWLNGDSPVYHEMQRAGGCPSADNGNTTVYIVGGDAAISNTFETSLEAACFPSTVRLGGADRWSTSTAVASEVLRRRSGSVEVGIASGQAFPDATAMSAWAAKTSSPLILVPKALTNGRLPDATEAWLTNNASRISHIHFAGGTAAVSTAVWDRVAYLTNYRSMTRHSGDTRYDTAVAIAENLFSSPDGVVLATGSNWPDAVSAGALTRAYKESGGRLGWPILFTPEPNVTSSLHPSTAAYASRSHVKGAYVVGGPEVVGRAAMAELEAAT